MKQQMSLEEVAARLRMPADKVSEMAAAGKLPGSIVDGQWRFERERVEEWENLTSRVFEEIFGPSFRRGGPARREILDFDAATGKVRFKPHPPQPLRVWLRSILRRCWYPGSDEEPSQRGHDAGTAGGAATNDQQAQKPGLAECVLCGSQSQNSRSFLVRTARWKCSDYSWSSRTSYSNFHKHRYAVCQSCMKRQRSRELMVYRSCLVISLSSMLLSAAFVVERIRSHQPLWIVPAFMLLLVAAATGLRASSEAREAGTFATVKETLKERALARRREYDTTSAAPGEGIIALTHQEYRDLLADPGRVLAGDTFGTADLEDE